MTSLKLGDGSNVTGSEVVMEELIRGEEIVNLRILGLERSRDTPFHSRGCDLFLDDNVVVDQRTGELPSSCRRVQIWWC